MPFDACYFCSRPCDKANISTWCARFKHDPKKSTAPDTISLYVIDEDYEGD